jgi:hypothetical protein
MTYCHVVIHGLHTSCKSPQEHVASIVYGEPVITVILVGSHFIALCEWDDPHTPNAAQYTFERMGSFNYGASLHPSRASAITEFGTWAYRWGPRGRRGSLTHSDPL